VNQPIDPLRSAASRVGEPAMQSELAQRRAQQDRLFAEMLAGHQHFRALARSVWQVQEQERRRLARDLHDGVGQNLTALKHTLAEAIRDPAAPPELRERVQRALEVCAATLEEVRALARALRPQILDDLGLAAALGWLGRTAGEAGGFTVAVDCSDDLPEVQGDLATLVFRIVQEALANATRHARCSHVMVRVAIRDDVLSVLVADDGVGCDVGVAEAAAASGASAGLGSMRERVGLFGGRLQLASTAGGGMQVRATLPISPH
jgi:two-component system sensor histidine kinase UhpB